MSAIGTGYDLSASQYSPDGRVFQIEYAKKAVDSSGNVIAIKGKDGVVIASEKYVISKLYEATSNSRLFSIANHISCGVVGFYPDAKALVEQGRSYAEEFYNDHGYPIPVTTLKDRLGAYVGAYTCSSAVRPFGATLILAAFDGVPLLYTVDPDGSAVGYHYVAAGKGKQAAKAELEKLGNMTCRELVKEAARIIYMIHDEVKDKAFRLELSWIGEFTKGEHQLVPEDVYKEAEQYAKDANRDDSSDEEMAAR
jgi:20S proteasome subunit alpha 7